MQRAGSNGYHQIGAVLRREWLRGTWQAGRQCPSHAELQRRFQTTEVTIQRAMHLLVRQGFIETHLRRGRFLAARPPHEHQYGLGFLGHPADIGPAWSRFSLALFVAADALSEAGPCRIRPYFDLGIETPGWGGEALSADIAAHCLRGVIFGDAPQALSHTPLLEHPQVPVVVPSTFVCLRALHVGLGDGFAPCAMARARAEGFRRVGVLTVFGPAPERWRDMAERTGLQTQPAWIQGVDRFDRSWLRHGLEVVVGAASRERPEVLVLTDDHLVDPAVEELQRMKIRVPEDLVVIAHWNFPLPYTGALPVRLLGPDMREFLRLAIQRVDEHLRGKPIPPDSSVPARFGEEIEAGTLSACFQGLSCGQIIDAIRVRETCRMEERPRRRGRRARREEAQQ